MKLEVTVTVSSDDGKVSKSSTNALVVATGVGTMNNDVQKQDFLTHADNLIRSVGENQVPALYAAVFDETWNTNVPDAPADEETQAESTVRSKLKSLRDKKAKKEEQQPEDNGQTSGGDNEGAEVEVVQ